MRNYEREIEGIQAEIKTLQVRKVKEGKRLEELKRLKRQSPITNKHQGTHERDGNLIHIHDQVTMVTKGKFNVNEGKVAGIKTWVAFEGHNDVK